MVVLFDAGEPNAAGHAELVCRSVADTPGILSLSATCRRGHELEDGVRSIEWTADHAAQLGAAGAGLILAGVRRGAAVAAALALRARDDGWPDVVHQLLIHPRFRSAKFATPLSGLAPATVIGGDEASRAYAVALRRAGVSVKHIRHSELAGRLAEVVGTLRHSPDGAAS
jgi:acetyl esterase/lipase